MSRLVSQKEIEMAQHSMRSLRSAVGNTSKNVVGTEAREHIRLLSTHVNSASVAVDVLREDVHNPQAKAIVNDYERIEKTTRDIVADLSKDANYQGPRRSIMSAVEKSQFISKHGMEKFLLLPW